VTVESGFDPLPSGAAQPGQGPGAYPRAVCDCGARGVSTARPVLSTSPLAGRPTVTANDFAPAAAAFVVAVTATPALKRPALWLGLVDLPGDRKRHQHATPLVGGMVILLALAAGVGSLRFAHDDQPGGGWGLLLGALLVLGIGLVDDHRDLPPATKLAVQTIAATIAVADARLHLLSELVGAPAGFVLAVVWIVAVTNAVNFLDSSDGLAATVGLVIVLLLLGNGWITGQTHTVPLLLALAGALSGFLVFNLPRASVFLGDGGSLLLGFLLAHSAASLTWFDLGGPLTTPWWSILAPILVLAVPLYDLVGVVALRLLTRRPIWRADECHFAHRLSRRGLGPRAVLLVVVACSLAIGLGGVLLPRLDGWQALLVTIQALTMLAVLILLDWIPASGQAPTDRPPRHQP
jgi:UDP-GlcNAc:undecaprenyl-phosphate/decaprenyl-phosphate GlcNAc-1-phosphate transferase